MIHSSKNLSNKALQLLYDKLINSINFFNLQCPSCLNKHSFIRHAKYTRSIVIAGVKFQIVFIRLICTECNVTHAIIPTAIIPYTRRTLSDTIAYLKHLINDKVFYDAFSSYVYHDISNLKKQFEFFLYSINDIIKNEIDIEECLSLYLFKRLHLNLTQMRGRETDFIIET